MIDERYKAALGFFNHEFRTLGERASIFAVAQSILISASVLMLTNDILGYILPYLLSGVVIIGAVFCLLHFEAGKRGADSAFRWKKYMLLIEADQSDMPWAWFYSDYQKKHGDRRTLEKLPLPSNWLYLPTIFTFIWLVASAYLPYRICVDETFVAHSSRTLAFYVSMIPGAVVVGIFCWLSWSVITYWKGKEVSGLATKEKALKSASDVAAMADFISKALTLNYPPQALKAILEVPMRQLEDELQTLKAYVQALK